MNIENSIEIEYYKLKIYFKLCAINLYYFLFFIFYLSSHPCLCLCFGVLQITQTRFLRRMILQSLQIFFTEALTFITK